MKPKSQLDEIACVLARIDDPKLIRGFLEGLLTRRELAEVEGRWQIVKLLKEGVSQRRIARDLRMSLCKITRGSRELKKRDSPLGRVLEIHDGSQAT